MIPRRRIALRRDDLADWLRAWKEDTAFASEAIGAFEQVFADRIGARHALAVASGRDALTLIIDGLGLGAGDELIVPAYTLGELLPLLQKRGLRLVAADVDPRTFNVTPDSVRSRISANTRAILVLHAFGAPCDIRGLCALADSYHIPLIEDCAHAPGAMIGGRLTGSFGKAALFSLEATKAISSFGGGVVTTSDATLAETIATKVSSRPQGNCALRRIAFKWGEELLVRSPLYGPLARVLFSEKVAASFERFYRRTHSRVRSGDGAPQEAFSALQARLAQRRLKELETRNRRLNLLWQELADRLPENFQAQRRDSFGTPAFYNFVARFAGDTRRLRQAAHRRGIDLGIGSEVMDNVAPLLDTLDCPGVAELFASAVMIPLYDDMPRSRVERIVRTLEILQHEAA